MQMSAGISQWFQVKTQGGFFYGLIAIKEAAV